MIDGPSLLLVLLEQFACAMILIEVILNKNNISSYNNANKLCQMQLSYWN